MPLYEPHFLVNFGGTVGTANPEIWSCGIRLWAPDYGGFDEIGYTEDVAKPALTDWVNRVGSKIGDWVSMDWIKGNMIGSDGNYLEPNNPHTIFLSPVVVGEIVMANAHPYQCCVVLGFRTNDVTRGPASKGRIYSPGPAVNVPSSTGLMSTGDADAIAASASLLLNALDVSLGAETLRPSIMSGIDGAHHQIDSVVVDNRLDIQRRRANSLTAASSTSLVVYT